MRRKDIVFISLHFNNGINKKVKSNCFCSSCFKDGYTESFLFAVINFTGGNYKITSDLPKPEYNCANDTLQLKNQS